MLDLSKTCQYGLRGLIFLIKNEERMPIKIAEIAQNENIPLNYLRKIFQQLIKAGIAVSLKGPTGGVSLTPDSKSVTILKIIEIIDGPMKTDECPILGLPNCPKIYSCPVKKECNSLNQNIYGFFDKYTLEHFAAFESTNNIK